MSEASSDTSKQLENDMGHWNDNFWPWTISSKTPPRKYEKLPFSTFFIVFCDFFGEFKTDPLTFLEAKQDPQAGP